MKLYLGNKEVKARKKKKFIRLIGPNAPKTWNNYIRNTWNELSNKKWNEMN